MTLHDKMVKHNTTIKCIEAMRLSIGLGLKKTYVEWGQEFMLTVENLYCIVSLHDLSEAVATYASAQVKIRKIQKSKNRNDRCKSYTKQSLRIGKTDLIRAGLLGKSIRQIIDRGKITLEAMD